MNNKVAFRYRAFDVSKPMLIYTPEDLSKLPNREATGSRDVPQMPSGMEKLEENELHLKEAILSGQAIPIPEYEALEGEGDPQDPPRPRHPILQRPFPPDSPPAYDIDSDDERFLQSQTDIEVLKFERLIEGLEKHSTHRALTLDAARGLFPEDEVCTLAVYEYWLNKRLMTKLPLIPRVPNESKPTGDQSYVAFRRRVDKRVTRRNRRNDEISYFKMIRLREDLSKVLQILLLVRQRDEAKKTAIELGVGIVERRYRLQDFSGSLYDQVVREEAARPCGCDLKFVRVPRRVRRRAIERRRVASGSEDPLTADDENNPFGFRRKLGCSYLPPAKDFFGPCETVQVVPTTVITPKRRGTIYARRRVGRGGRVVLDRFAIAKDRKPNDQLRVLREIDSMRDVDVDRLRISIEEDGCDLFETEIDAREFRGDKENTEVVHCRGKVAFTGHLTDIRYTPGYSPVEARAGGRDG